MKRREAELLRDACQQLADIVVEGYESFRGGKGNREEAGKAFVRVLEVHDLLNHILREVPLPRDVKQSLYDLYPKLNLCELDAQQNYGW